MCITHSKRLHRPAWPSAAVYEPSAWSGGCGRAPDVMIALSAHTLEAEPSGPGLQKLSVHRPADAHEERLPDRRQRRPHLRSAGAPRAGCLLLAASFRGRRRSSQTHRFLSERSSSRATQGWVPLEASQALEELSEYAPVGSLITLLTPQRHHISPPARVTSSQLIPGRWYPLFRAQEPAVYKFLIERLLSLGHEVLYELHFSMISLGKTFCSKRSPHCSQCPVAEHCEYQKNGGTRLKGAEAAAEAPPSTAAGTAGGAGPSAATAAKAAVPAQAGCGSPPPSGTCRSESVGREEGSPVSVLNAAAAFREQSQSPASPGTAVGGEAPVDGAAEAAATNATAGASAAAAQLDSPEGGHAQPRPQQQPHGGITQEQRGAEVERILAIPRPGSADAAEQPLGGDAAAAAAGEIVEEELEGKALAEKVLRRTLSSSPCAVCEFRPYITAIFDPSPMAIRRWSGRALCCGLTTPPSLPARCVRRHQGLHDTTCSLAVRSCARPLKKHRAAVRPSVFNSKQHADDSADILLRQTVQRAFSACVLLAHPDKASHELAGAAFKLLQTARQALNRHLLKRRGVARKLSFPAAELGDGEAPQQHLSAPSAADGASAPRAAGGAAAAAAASRAQEVSAADPTTAALGATSLASLADDDPNVLGSGQRKVFLAFEVRLLAAEFQHGLRYGVSAAPIPLDGRASSPV